MLVNHRVAAFKPSSHSQQAVRMRCVAASATKLPHPENSHNSVVKRSITGVTATFLAVVLTTSEALAVGIESFDLLPQTIEKPEFLGKGVETQKQKLQEAEDAFQNSSTLKELLAKSEANRSKNKKEIENKYCYRQAELGIGDCGGLQYIPGLTKSGKQKTPQWLADLLGVELPPEDDTSELTLKDLFGKEYD